MALAYRIGVLPVASRLRLCRSSVREGSRSGQAPHPGDDMMKRLILGAGACALAFASVLPSFAADMPRGRYAEPAPSYFSWTGFYLGLNGGYGWGTSDWSSGVTAGSTGPAGGPLGGTIGLNVTNGA